MTRARDDHGAPVSRRAALTLAAGLTVGLSATAVLTRRNVLSRPDDPPARDKLSPLESAYALETRGADLCVARIDHAARGTARFSSALIARQAVELAQDKLSQSRALRRAVDGPGRERASVPAIPAADAIDSGGTALSVIDAAFLRRLLALQLPLVAHYRKLARPLEVAAPVISGGLASAIYHDGLIRLLLSTR